MSYNFPSPHRPKRRPWGLILVLLIAGVIGFSRFGSQLPSLPPMVEKWPQKLFPKLFPPAPESSPQQRTPSSQIPGVVKLPDWPRPNASAPQVTPPAIASRQPIYAELTRSNLPLRLPDAPDVQVVRDARVQELEAKIAKYPVFSLYRSLADRHLELGQTEAAAKVFRTQAALYRRKGLEDAALILEKRAAQSETTLRVFAARAGNETSFTGAPLEPKRGCYLGAFIDRDDALKTQFRGDNWQSHRLPSEFEARVGRRHASVFTYVKWGNFPRQWLSMCKREGVIPHIAWEPQDLSEVRDDAYLRSCAQFLRELDHPVFVRFASEMNGDWTPYHGDPELYREKFRLVNRVLHRYAAKVATIWCVNAIPSDNIDAYYPGDTGCDWVGVNLYSTPFADNDRSREAFKESPLALLEPIYRRYSARKPIAIGEYGASHQSAVDGVVRTDFATEKMALLYGALPLLYPRVKLISYFSSNNLVHAREGRKLNNYRLTQQPLIQETYRQLTASPHFLTSFSSQKVTASAQSIREISSADAVRRGERVQLWITGTDARPRVFAMAGKRVFYAGRQVGHHVIEVPQNAPSLSLLVYDGRGRCVARRNLLSR
jgi:hypothetical protein